MSGGCTFLLGKVYNIGMDFQVGRRLFRQRLEIGDREGAVEERRVSREHLSYVHLRLDAWSTKSRRALAFVLLFKLLVASNKSGHLLT